ncbi:hypothetical protein ABT301_00825 [Streptomyces sp. NPDC000987]|uniref:hypothetical protein n=1 Tax=Streptomyces sp. NPDC000987 TaxID=3154374 RepID=UPI00332CD354
MSGELIRRQASKPMPARTQRVINNVSNETYVERAVIHAKAVVAEQALNEVAYLTALKNQLETAHPDASESIAFIVATAVQGIAQSVGNFARGLD